MRRHSLFLLLALTRPALAAGGTAAQAVIETSPKLAAEDAPFVATAITAFRAQCGPLMRSWSDVARAYAEIATAGVAEEAEHGWARRVVVRIDLEDEPKRIPAAWDAGGRTCYFDLGGGRQPGLDVGMPLCRSLCAVPAPGFIALPALGGLN